MMLKWRRSAPVTVGMRLLGRPAVLGRDGVRCWGCCSTARGSHGASKLWPSRLLRVALSLDVVGILWQRGEDGES